MVVTTNHVRHAAAPILGRARKGRDGEFESFFWADATQIAFVWNCFTWPPDIQLVHLLWALLFMKVYATTRILIRLVGQDISPATFRKKVWTVLDILAAQLPAVVSIAFV